MQTPPEEKHTINAADVVRIDGIGIKFWVETECGKRLEIFLEHRNHNTQMLGQKAFSALTSALNMHSVEDTSEFIGKSIDAPAWRQVAEMALPAPSVSHLHRKPPSRRVVSNGGGRFVYVITCENSAEPLCKIGIANSPEKRLKQLSTGSPHSLRIELTRYASNASAVERAAHLHFIDQRRNGEWFAITADQAIVFVIEATRSAA